MIAGRAPIRAAEAAAITVLGVKLLGMLFALLAPVMPQDPLLAAICELLLYLLRIGVPLTIAVSAAPAVPFSQPDARLKPADRLLLPLAAVGLGLCANYLSALFAGLLQNVGVHLAAATPDFSDGSTVAVELLAWTVFPAVLEELLFRGYIQGILTRYGVRRAILISALLFALCHNTLGQILPALVMGVCLGALRALSGSVLLPIATHLLYNSLAAVAAIFGVGGALTASFALLALAAIILENGRFSLPPDDPGRPSAFSGGWMWAAITVMALDIAAGISFG